MKLIFVYGSLLSNMGNWRNYLNNDSSRLLGKTNIQGGYKMISFVGFPGVINDNKYDNVIVGEVYEVSDDVALTIDRLEGFVDDINRNFYNKVKVNTEYGIADMYVLNTNIRDYDEGHYKTVLDGDWKAFKNIYQ